MDFLFFLEGIRTPLLDAFFLLCTNFGESLLLILILCTLYWCVDKKLAKHASAAFFISAVPLQTLKVFFRIERPWIIDTSFRPVQKALSHATGYSFPSGHSQSAAAVWGSFAANSKNKRLSISFIIFIILTVFSRMYLGCHTPKDVIIGALLGLFGVIIIQCTLNFFKSRPLLHRERFELVAAITFCILSFLCCFYTISLVNTNVISYDNAKDSLTLGGSAIGFALGSLLEKRYIKFSPASSLYENVTRFSIGAIFLIILKILLGLASKDYMLLRIAEYAILLFFIAAGYPFLFTKTRLKHIFCKNNQ